MGPLQLNALLAYLTELCCEGQACAPVAFLRWSRSAFRSAAWRPPVRWCCWSSSRKGIAIGWGYYFKVGLVLTLPVLSVALAALALRLTWR